MNTSPKSNKIMEENLKNFFITHSKDKHKIFQRFPNQSKWDRSVFQEVFHKNLGITDDLLSERMFRVLDSDCDSMISIEDFIGAISLFLSNDIDQKIYCIF